MSKNTIKDIDNVLRTIDSDIAVLESRIAKLRETWRSLLEYRNSYDPSDSTNESTVMIENPVRSNSRVRMPLARVKEVRNALWEILRASSGPMHPSVMLTVLADRGIVVEGQNPISNIRSHLSHDTRFRSIGNGEWDLVNRSIRTTVSQANEQRIAPESIPANDPFQDDEDNEGPKGDFDDVPF